MGLKDRIKDAQQGAAEMAKQAQEAAMQQAGAAGGADGAGGADIQKMQDTNRISQQGLDGEATIKKLSKTGNTDLGGADEYKIEVEASIGGDSYKATALQNLLPKYVDSYQVGKKFEIKADPEDKTKILLMAGID